MSHSIVQKLVDCMLGYCYIKCYNVYDHNFCNFISYYFYNTGYIYIIYVCACDCLCIYASLKRLLGNTSNINNRFCTVILFI